MRRAFSYLRFALWGVLISAFPLASCSEDTTPARAPNLIALELLDPSGTVLDLRPNMDAGMATAVSPLSSVRATFDALLDPSKVQELSGSTAAPGRGVAYVQWLAPNGPMQLGLLAQYNPSQRQNYGPAPTVTFTAPQALPSGVALTFVLERSRLTDKSGRPFVGVAGGVFETRPFTATVTLPQTPQPLTFTPRISFSSIPGPLQAGAVFVLRAGVQVQIEIVADPSARNTWAVSPVGQGVPWSPGLHQLHLVPEKITDAFGTALPASSYVFPFVVGAVAVDGGLQDGSTAQDAAANDAAAD